MCVLRSLVSCVEFRRDTSGHINTDRFLQGINQSSHVWVGPPAEDVTEDFLMFFGRNCAAEADVFANVDHQQNILDVKQAGLINKRYGQDSDYFTSTFGETSLMCTGLHWQVPLYGTLLIRGIAS